MSSSVTTSAPASTWGIPPATRKKVRTHILALRTALEEDARKQLAAMGITAAGIGEVPASLSREDRKARSVVEAIIGKAREAGDPTREAVADYIRETAFTFLDRAVALRCLEERGLLIVDGLPESVIRLDPVTGVSSLVHRVRSEQRDLGPREVAREAFRRACAAVTTRVRVLFDPDAEHAQLFPLPATWEKLVAALNDPAIPVEAYREDEILGWVYQLT